MWETEAGWAPAPRKEEEAGQAQDRDAPGAQASVWHGCRSAGLVCVKPPELIPESSNKTNREGKPPSPHCCRDREPQGWKLGRSQSSWGERTHILKRVVGQVTADPGRSREMDFSSVFVGSFFVCCKLFFRRLSFWSFLCLSRIIFKFLIDKVCWCV